MDIRAKVEARKAELRDQLARQQAQDRLEAQEIAQRRFAALDATTSRNDGVAMSFEKPSPSSVYEALPRVAALDQQVDVEVEKELEKRALNRWTTGEMALGVGLFVTGLALFFVHWIPALLALVLFLIHNTVVTEHYKRELRKELERL